jgi:hypothetical protein
MYKLYHCHTPAVKKYLIEGTVTDAEGRAKSKFFCILGCLIVILYMYGDMLITIYTICVGMYCLICDWGKVLLRSTIITAILTVSLVFCGCESIAKKSAPQPLPERVVVPHAKAARAAAAAPLAPPFVPPSDTVVSEQRFRVWRECNLILDSLAFFYSDSFKISDVVHTLRIQDDFRKAQDRICRRAGLPGGYAEHRWITENINHPINRVLLAEGN